jgi:hypothetical protein
VSLTPNSGTGLTQTFTVVVTDPNGLADLNQVQLLFNITPDRGAVCNVNYQLATNTMYLYNWGQFTTDTSNGVCTVNGFAASSSGNNFTLKVTLTFSAVFTGQKNAYVYVQGNDGFNNGGWELKGTWTVAALLQSITLSPNPSTLPTTVSEQFSATGQLQDGTTQDLTTSVT